MEEEGIDLDIVGGGMATQQRKGLLIWISLPREWRCYEDGRGEG